MTPLIEKKIVEWRGKTLANNAHFEQELRETLTEVYEVGETSGYEYGKADGYTEFFAEPNTQKIIVITLADLRKKVEGMKKDGIDAYLSFDGGSYSQGIHPKLLESKKDEFRGYNKAIVNFLSLFPQQENK